MSNLSKPRLVSMAIVAIIVVVGLGWFINKYLLRSRAAGANASLALTSAVTVDSGQEFDVPITVNTDDAEVVAVDLQFNFDKDMLELVNFQFSGPVASYIQTPQENGSFNTQSVVRQANDAGILRVGALSQPENPASPGFSGSANIGTLRFRARQGGSTPVEIVHGTGRTNESNLILRGGVDTLAQTTNMTVTINGGQPPVSPTEVQATNTPTPTGNAEQTYEITGSIFHDQNQNGLKDDSEPALDRLVYLRTVDGNTLMNQNASNNGLYRLANVRAGLYAIEVLPQDGWRVTTNNIISIQVPGRLQVDFGLIEANAPTITMTPTPSNTASPSANLQQSKENYGVRSNPGEVNPLDRNNDGKVNVFDVIGWM